MRTSIRLLAAVALSATALGGAAASAQAELAFGSGGVIGELGSPQAGAHADFHTAFELRRDAAGDPTGTIKDLDVDLPRGLVGDPGATPTCDPKRVQIPVGPDACPISTAVGVVRFTLREMGDRSDIGPFTTFVYNVRPYGTQPAALMFNALIYPVRLDTSVRTDGGYGLRATISNLTEAQPLISTDLTLWGVPADRQGPGGLFDDFGQEYGGPTNLPRRAFLTNPSVCDGVPLQTVYSATPWQPQADVPVVATGTSAPLSGCEKQRFEPAIDVAPTNGVAGAPSGYAIDLAVPQSRAASGLATPPLKDATVTLPQGAAISPSAADGLDACSDEQLALRSAEAERCPDAARIGTTTIVTPLLEQPLTGSIYLGTQQSSDPASGEMYRLFLTAAGSGVRIKLRGAIRADPATGQLTTTFVDNPQLPFSKLSLRFKDGARAPLVNPSRCGEQTASATLTSWAGQVAQVSDRFTIDAGCPTGGFAPSFEAGTLNAAAGVFSPFTMTVRRGDGEADLSRIGLQLPSGLLGSLSTVPVCPETAASAGTCDVGSRLGAATVSVGAGAQPFSLGGTVYLAGPYKGSPFSLSIAVPAKAGPLDLGMVVVRAPLQIDAAGARVAAPADPLPQVVGGVPLRYRMVNITLDRPGFMFNATSCEPRGIGATLEGAGGVVAQRSAAYQAQGCAGLRFVPRLSMAFTGSGQRGRSGHPGLVARLGSTVGGAGLSRVRVELPLAVALDLDNSKQIWCKPAAAAARDCPASAIVGRATASTPALPRPLSGPVYFVDGRYAPAGSKDTRLPKLWLKLEGSGIPLDLWAESAVTKDFRLATTFIGVPDAPISGFELQIDAGARGILIATRGVCGSDRVAAVTYDGQNGARRTASTAIAAPGCRPRIAALKVGAGRRQLTATLTGLAAGRVVLAGTGARRVTRTVGGSTATVSVPLTATARRSLARGRAVTVRLALAFTPRAGGAASRATRTITIKPARRR